MNESFVCIGFIMAVILLLVCMLAIGYSIPNDVPGDEDEGKEE